MKKEHKMMRIAPMYVYATEMIAHYYRRMELKGKRVLTVIGSGDQVINAFFYGAREVVGFDINRNALFMTELRLRAISTLSYQEFLCFFLQTRNGFSHALYTKVWPSLSKACQRYFDQAYKAVGMKGLGVSEYMRDRKDFASAAKVRHINAYLVSEKAYLKMQEILVYARPTLRIENVLMLAQSKKFRKEKFDIINLSNVPNYLTGRSFGLTEETVLSYLRTLKKLLSANGIIFFYSYDNSIYPHTHSKRIPPASTAQFLKDLKRLDVFRVSQKSFPGLSNGKKDRITLLGC